jgi:pyrimidine operon attenuation protein / uracil phosphoribosyltransferase
MNAAEIEQAVERLAVEVAERARAEESERGLAIVGIRRGGVHLAGRLRALLARRIGREPPVGTIDIALYRDDLDEKGAVPVVGPTDVRFPVDGKTVVLVDDVLYTGRTIRAAMDALIDYGRPQAIRLAVLVDRGHRELPIRADHVGKNVPTSREEVVKVTLEEIDGDDAVEIERRPGLAVVGGTAA